MGTKPITPTYDAGDECTRCVSASFNGVTPLYAEANVVGLVACPAIIDPLVDGVFLLTQNSFSPCRWDGVSGNMDLILIYSPAGSSFQISRVGTFFQFLSQSAVQCKSSFSNDIAACGPIEDQATGGSVKIFWGPTIGP